jgi:hypothetical protein
MRSDTMVKNSSERALTIAWFVAALMVALILGLAFAHVMELPGKLRMDGPTWLTVQQNLYIGFGPLAAVVEPVGILLTWVLVFMLRRRGRSSFRLALLAAACATIGLVEWALIVSPMNALLNGWTAATLPPDWTACRDRWEIGHAIHAALFGVTFCALLGSMLAKQAVESNRLSNA